MQDKEIAHLLKEFRISESVGFVLECPAVELPAKFAAWAQICDSMPTLVEKHTVREAIGRMPLIDSSSIETYEQLRLAHLLLATLAAGYIWHAGEREASAFIPRQIAVPFWEISERLGTKPCVTHLTACLANWRLVDPTGPISALNMRLIAFRFIEDFGNEWFFLNTAQMEIDFAPVLIEMIRACARSERVTDRNAQQAQHLAVTRALDVLAHTLHKSTATLRDMRLHLRPDVFYHGFRRFMAGFSRGIYEQQGGIIFEGVDGIGPQKFDGGSAAQSSTLQAADSFLGVKHRGAEAEFLLEQRNYMPPEHKRFLEFLDRKSPVQRLLPTSQALKCSFDNCMDALVVFRNQHIQIVASYIIAQRKTDENSVLAQHGTGGTGFVAFLKAIRDNLTKYYK
uniref:Indoleamine 2,3-dioxygenase n=1 Tax=Plectus sambesii TaxID=2011161 RepID=A0A914UNV1_9BILA